MAKDIVDDRIETINRILDKLDRIEMRIDQLNSILFKGDYTAEEFHSMVTERSGLIKTRNDLESQAKDTYKLKLAKEHGDLMINNTLEI